MSHRPPLEGVFGFRYLKKIKASSGGYFWKISVLEWDLEEKNQKKLPILVGRGVF